VRHFLQLTARLRIIGYQRRQLARIALRHNTYRACLRVNHNTNSENNVTVSTCNELGALEANHTLVDLLTSINSCNSAAEVP
jgi:hypothetical protein